VSEFAVDGGKYFAGTIRDLTEDKKRLADLERSNRDLERFAYVASHDLQTPARSIMGFVQILLEELSDGSLTEEQEEYFDIIFKASERMRAQIQGLLQLSRLQPPEDGLTLVDLTMIAHASQVHLQERINDSHATITIHPKLGQVWGDETQLRLLFENLLSNSIKYGEPTTWPTIEISRVEHSSPNIVHFVVRDHGIGIPLDQRERVFEIFHRLHAPSQNQYQGTGIGLALVRRIVDQHHGHITIETPPDFTGTEFHVFLPTSPKQYVSGSAVKRTL